MSASLTHNQLYELRPLCDLTKNMAIGNGSKTNGAKAIIYDEVYYLNDQKWIALQDATIGSNGAIVSAASGSGWSLVNMESLKYTVVWWPTSASPWNVGQDIVQWEGGGENKWLTATQVDTVTYGGVECPVCIFKVKAHDGYSYSVSDALYYGSLQVKLAATDTTKDTQKWVCIPTVARDYANAAPYDMGVSGSTIQNAANSISYSVYPKWKVTEAVAARSGVTYVLRYRSRTMGTNNVWNGWTDWTVFQTVSVTRTGQDVTASSALTKTLSSTDKMGQIAYQVRTVAPGSGNGNIWDRPWGSAATEYTVNLYPKPVLTVSSVTWTPDGLSVAATSSYTSRGATTVRIESVKISGTEYLKEPVTGTLVGDSGETIDIPQGSLMGIPASGASATITYSVGSDTKGMFDGTSSVTKTVTNNSGNVTPTIADNAGFTKKVTVSNSTDTRVWMLYDGNLIECKDGVVIYPFGEEYTLYAVGTQNSTKFAWSQTYTGASMGIHAWNWDGGSASLEMRKDEPLSTDDEIEASSESYELSGRSWETVDFSGVRHQKVTAKGAVSSSVTTSKRKDFHLLAGTHAIYRSPAGDMFDVAVMSVSREDRMGRTEIDVTMVREG